MQIEEKTLVTKTQQTSYNRENPRPKKPQSLLVLADLIGFAAERELLYFTDFSAYYAPDLSMRGQQRPDEGPS